MPPRSVFACVGYRTDGLSPCLFNAIGGIGMAANTLRNTVCDIPVALVRVAAKAALDERTGLKPRLRRAAACGLGGPPKRAFLVVTRS